MKELAKKDIAKNLPAAPGVYKMIDRERRVIYVGKAKDLQKRVKTYFQKGYEHSTRTRKLIENTANIDFIQTDSELEALLLENNLIKELKPRYNILMKDDKSYVYIKVNWAEDFPRIRAVRERTLEKTESFGPRAKYFGPKLASSKVYETLRILKKLFPFRHCNLDIKFKTSDSLRAPQSLSLSPNKDLVDVTNRVIDFPCLDYYIKRCPGPCIGAISPIEYKKIVQQIMDFLEGKNDELEKSIKKQMTEAAQQKLFEKAVRLRDKLFALQSITERQKIIDHDRHDTDIVNFSADLGRVFFNILMIRGGKLISQENFALDALEMKEIDAPIDLVEVLQSFLLQYYERAADIPKEILVPEELEDCGTFEKWLTQKRGDQVHILSPQKGEKNKLLELSHKNAVSFGKQFRIRWLSEQRGQTALARLAEVLNMKDKILKRIEGFDISHLGGNETVGSMVVFENGLPKSSDYRHFKIRTVSGKPDDYRSMEETLMRRLKYLAKNPASEIQIKIPTKKDFEEIKRIVKQKQDALSSDNFEKRDFLVAKKGKAFIGFGRLFQLDPKVTLLMTLWVHPDFRGARLGYQIMDKLIAKSKRKRIYLNCRKALENYYAEYGFVALRQPPEAMEKRIDAIMKNDPRKKRIIEKHGLVYMAYDVKKHKPDASFASKPNLLVIDGGKGQLNTALLALKRLKLEIPVIALAKRLEEIYLPGEKAPLLLEEGDEALKLLQRIRDESHRFAITFQRKLHRKDILQE